MRPAEVVAVDEEGQPSHAIIEVREDRPAQKLLPQRAPEALHLPQRLRVVWPTLDVLDVLSTELRFELRLPSPRRVLPPVVRQHLPRRSEGCHPAFERLHHQRGLLAVCDGVPDDEAAVVVHEDGHVEPLMPAQEEGEDVGLPQLVWLGPLEARLGPRCLLHLGRPRLEQPLLVENPPHRRLRHAQALEASQHVGDPTRAQCWTVLFRSHHKCAPRVFDARRGSSRSRLSRHQRWLSAMAEGSQPLGHRRFAHSEDACDLGRRRPLLKHLAQHPQPELGRVARHALRPSSSLAHCRVLSRPRVGLRRAAGAKPFGPSSDAHQLARIASFETLKPSSPATLNFRSNSASSRCSKANAEILPTF
jgi:hypothetical protein